MLKTVNLNPHSDSSRGLFGAWQHWHGEKVGIRSGGFYYAFPLTAKLWPTALCTTTQKSGKYENGPLFQYQSSVNWPIWAFLQFVYLNEKAVYANIICHVMQQRQLFHHILTKLYYNEFKVNKRNINHFKKHIFEHGPNIPAD